MGCVTFNDAYPFVLMTYALAMLPAPQGTSLRMMYEQCPYLSLVEALKHILQWPRRRTRVYGRGASRGFNFFASVKTL